MFNAADTTDSYLRWRIQWKNDVDIVNCPRELMEHAFSAIYVGYRMNYFFCLVLEFLRLIWRLE